MPKIIPIEDLKNTSKISEMCKESDEPVFVTKNGYGDMVIMSAETYEKKFHLLDVYEKLDEADRQVKSNKASDAYEALSKLRKKYRL
jgi:prevent-host-death family protein